MTDHDPIIAALQALQHTANRQDTTLSRQADMLATQSAQLTEHMRRTSLSEDRIIQVEEFVTETRSYMQSIKILGMVVAGIFAIAGTIVALVALIHTW